MSAMLSDPQLHYLDNAATSRVDPAVAQAVSEALTELWANPSSLYDPAVAARPARVSTGAIKSSSRALNTPACSAPSAR